MNTICKTIFSTCFIILLASCSADDFIGRLEQIKAVGDDNPVMAINMLDSLDFDFRNADEYKKAKYDLLRIRLNDKADICPNSDIAIKRLVAYFEKHGSLKEKQEVYYYAGSVYRDLQDSPRALSFFLKSLACVKKDVTMDSLMIRNTYSNLSYIYYHVQNYQDAVTMAKNELGIRKEIGNDLVLPYMHMGSVYLAMDSLQNAKAAFDSAYERVVETNEYNEDVLIHLLCNYAILEDTIKAHDCFRRIKIDSPSSASSFSCISFAFYFDLIGDDKNAIECCRSVIENSADYKDVYDAAKLLFKIYTKQGNFVESSRYADIYMELSDSLDFGKRQELAATVNNEYKYHLDLKKEQTLKNEKQKYKIILYCVVLFCVFAACVIYIVYIKKRNKRLNELIKLSKELQRVTEEEKNLLEEIRRKEKELEVTKKSLNDSSSELKKMEQELVSIKEEVAEYSEELRLKELLLTEKDVQNKNFIKLLYKSEFEGQAEDIIQIVRQASTGRKNMNAMEWKQLYGAVDELYPLFRERLLNELDSFTEQQMQVCYLMRIGLSKPQIQNITDLSRATIWRWVKKYEWVLTPEE